MIRNINKLDIGLSLALIAGWVAHFLFRPEIHEGPSDPALDVILSGSYLIFVLLPFSVLVGLYFVWRLKSANKKKVT